MHHDCAGRLLSVGMQVAANRYGDKPRLDIYEVASFTTHKVRLRRIYKDARTNRFEYSRDEGLILKFPEDVAIIDPVF